MQSIGWNYVRLYHSKYEGCSESSENVGPIWAHGVQSGNTVQWYVAHTYDYQKYKFQLNRIKSWIFLIICVKRIRVPPFVFYILKKCKRILEQRYTLKFCVKFGETVKESMDMLQQGWWHSCDYTIVLSVVQCVSRWWRKCSWWTTERLVLYSLQQGFTKYSCSYRTRRPKNHVC